MFSHFIPKRAGIRYVLVGVVAFTMGSAGVVVGSTFSNAPVFRLGDATDPAALAAVDAAGSLHVSQQGTISASVTNSDFPDAGTHTKLDSANAKLDSANAQLGQLTFDGSGNLKTAPQGTAQVSGSVSVNNFPSSVNIGNLPSDQQIHGSVTVTNLPTVTGGVTEIDLPTHTAVPSGKATEWDGIDVSSCRSLTVGVKTIGDGNTPAPSGLDIYTESAIGEYVDVDVHSRTGTHTTGGASVWGFPTQPGTNEPFFATTIGLYAYNGDSVARDMVAAIYCSH